MDSKARHRVVIVGGGFAGLFAVRALRRGPFAITLIDQSEHHLFQPLLYQCATGILSEGQITSPLRRVLRHEANVECVMARAVDVDARARKVICHRPLGSRLEADYDYLIVAAGVEQSYFGHDEFRPLAPGMKTVADALTIRRRVFGAFEMAETAADAEERSRWLTFALVGAGPTGVELAGQIRELATKTLREEFRRAHPEDARVLLFDGGTEPLASFGEKLSARTSDALRALGVELHMGSTVTDVFPGGLKVADHQGQETSFDAATVLWTAGVAAPPFATALAKATGAEQDRAGRISVQDDLTIAGHPEISVAGDIMSLRKLPGVAEVAMQAGHYTGRRIRQEVAGQDQGGPFRYRDLGSAAYIARGRAVVSAGHLNLSGFVGWVFWLFIHIAFLTGFRNRIGALLTWWVAFTRDIRRERAFTAREVGLMPTIYSQADGGPEPGSDGH
ncbi:MAG TPA: NAD(P)/FAD-dependent oxidoreductase [Streptosporangiaceae bacterium]|nr:NAD(P)/FAD-dependent oxidoreductase [Streptosporangiaceae bacterium]